ncbi:hypothetical protein [uncultured Draconibacterium sp.]|uniref:hypothetical protein n=1 Tax=uncultured Draconibacterium sp. TaxID=1573823 RepID=UPI003217D055
MKGIYIKIFTGFLVVFYALNVSAQRANGLAVEGHIAVEEGSAEGAIIQMYEDGRRLDNYGVGGDGKYKVELNWNHKFELIFQREGNFQQKIVVETAVPKAVLVTDPKFPPFPVDINLFTEIPGVDNSFSENTVLKIFYSPSVDNFVSELYYNDAQIRKLIDQAILQGQMVDKNADYMSKLTRAELAELRKEYNELLEQAGKEYSSEKFLAALDGYKAASKILPGEQFPKDRIAEINDLLGLIMAAEELDQAKQKRFDDLVKEGDLFFMQTAYSEAKKSYDRALSIKPFDKYVNDQLKKIADLLQKQLQDEKYLDLIAQGDKAIKERFYNEALGVFNNALEIKPNEQYPKTKIAEINGLLAEQQKDQEKQENYTDAMFEGEKQFTKQFYDRALTSFQNALNYRPGDIKATRRIEETQKIMKDILDQMSFDKFIAEADKAYKRKDYPEALTNYEEALALVPTDPRAKKRVEEINEILYTERSFAEFVTQADKQFDAKSYANAKSLYEKALAINSSDKHVSDQIAAINTILAQQGVDEQYNQSIASADDLLAQKEYGAAKGKYNEALSLKPKEKYPKDKIVEIDAALVAIAKTERDYQDAVSKGDRFFEQKNYVNAKTAFADAGAIKPDESYPQEMIGKIDGLIAEEARLLAQKEADEKARLEAAAAAEAARLAAIQAEKDKNYADAIARADNFFDAKEYDNSRNEYRAALDVKPEEAYPQQRIDEIGTILAQLSAAQKAYEEAVAEGDREFRQEGWDAAIAAYNTAKQAKSDEIYPDEQLAKIDSIVTTRARLAQEAADAEAARLAAIQAEKDKNYADAIARADNFFDAKEYDNSRNEYRAALDVKPEEAYPQQRIDEIGTILAQLSAAQKAYEEAVAEGDREFRQEGWDAAIAAYNTAKQAKSDEIYPDEQLAKIDSIVTTRERLAQEAAAAEAARLAAIQAEKDKNYADAIARADNFFDAKEYDNSRNEYRAALDVKPEEAYPQQRIDEIGTILAQLSAAQKAYEEAVAEGDREFRKEGWDAAIAAYNTAKQAKSDEIYPDEQLAKIDSIVTTRERLAQEAAEAEAARLAAIQAEKDKNYTDAVARADNFFNAKEYDNSRNEYRAALDVKPEEAYPQQRIDEIGTILAQLSAAQKAYEEAVAEGDREFRQEGWDAAIAAYNTAKQAKSDEIYPDEQLAKIDSIRTERARLAQEAAEAEAARLAAIQAEKDKNYADAVARADNFFDAKEYDNSRNEYRAALDVKPEEAYPQQRIDEIGTILAQLSSAQKAYEEAVAEGDLEFRKEGWDAAIAAYNTAKQAKSDEIYPDEQLAKIDSIRTERARLAQEAAAAEAARLAAIQAEKDKNYADAIARADNFFEAKEYDNSRNEYRAALDVKPEEAYPQQRIDEIDGILRELAAAQAAQDALDKSYANLIQQADRMFNSQNYNPAKVNYQKALELKAEENYPKERIVEIDQILQQQADNERYRNIIVAADGYFRTQKYDDARLQYELALGVKPEEEYPRSQIMKIDEIRNQEQQRILAEKAAAEDLANRKADIAKMSEELDEQRILAESGINALYDQLILKADAFFDDKQYNVSRAWYYKANELKPEESYPPQRIDEINRILNGMMLSQRDREYQRFVDLGDTNFRENELAVARGWYNQALGQKADEEYPKAQLVEIERRVAERVAGQSQQQFDQFKSTADKAFEEQNYNVARFWYRKALLLRDDDEVKTKLDQIKELAQ